MKSYIKIGLVVLIIAVVGLIIYFVWSALAGPAPEIPNTPSTSSTLPTAPPSNGGEQSQGGTTDQSVASLKKISENPVFDFWIDPQTQEIYYLNPDGQVFSAKNGQDLQITQQKLSAPNFIRLSPNGQRVLVAFGDPRLPQWGVFDVIDKTWRPMPDGIVNVAWGENANTLIGFAKNGDNVNLSIINIGESQPSVKIIAKDLRFQDVNLDFSPPNNLFIEEKPAANYLGRIWSMNIKDLSIHSLFSPENGLMLGLSRDKTTALIFSSRGGFRILDAKTLNTVSPAPFSTLPSKCSPDSLIIYCFVPQGDNFKNAVLPDDYLEGKFYTSDSLYKINLGTDEITPIAIPQNGVSGPIDAENPVTQAGNLYFMNRYDDSLYILNFGSGNN